MISVRFTKEGNKLSLRVEGHARYAEHGKDIVCASATMLAFTVAQYVKMAHENGDLVSPAEIKLSSGDTFVSCEPNEETRVETQNMFSFARLGYQLLQHN